MLLQKTWKVQTALIAGFTKITVAKKRLTIPLLVRKTMVGKNDGNVYSHAVERRLEAKRMQML